MRKDYSPQELYEKLSISVIGQEDYLQKIAVIVWLHNKRIEAYKRNQYTLNKPQMQKYNLICVGPTGSGKTLALQKLASLYGMDLLVYDASGLTAKGWKGNDVEDVFKRLYYTCNRDISRCEKAIIVLDEYDKALFGHDYTDKMSSVENNLLKVIEGDKIDIEIKSSSCEKTYTIDTTNILFIVAGAFEGIEDIVRRRLCKKNLGFCGEIQKEYSDSELFQMVSKADLCSYGVGKQFLGRFSDIAILNELGIPELTRILLASDTSPVMSLGYTLRNTCGISVSITPEGATAVARQAVEEGTGARGLAQIIIPAINNTLFLLEEKDHVAEIQIIETDEGEPGIKLIDGERKPPRMYQPYDYKKDLIKPYKFPKAKRKNVEHFVNYIMWPGLEKEEIISLSDLKAVHALLCSIVFYLLEEHGRHNWTLDNIGKILNFQCDEKRYEDTMHLLDGRTKESVKYFKAYKHLKPYGYGERIAVRLFDNFMEHPYFGQDLPK